MVAVEAEAARSRDRSTLWCVLDTGAVGASLMLSRPAAEQLGLLPSTSPVATHATVATSTSAPAGERGSGSGGSGEGRDAAAERTVVSGGRADRRAELGPGVNVRGIASPRNCMQVAQLGGVWLGRHSVGAQRVYFTQDHHTMQTSVYGSSLACMGLLARFRIVLDVRNRRVAFRKDSDAV